jgi:two-component system nitrogen regulation sensor histidine kinase NtrY
MSNNRLKFEGLWRRLFTTESDKPNRARLRRIILGTLCILILLTITGIYFEVNPAHLVANNVIVYALVNVNIILLVALILLVLRNLLKLYFERRQGRLGSKFRTKLVTAFVGLALAPSILLFVVASGLISRSIESWFNSEVEQTLKDSESVVSRTSHEREERLVHLATYLAQKINVSALNQKSSRDKLKKLLTEKLDELQLGGIQLFSTDLRRHLSVRSEKAPNRLLVNSLKSYVIELALNGENVIRHKRLPTGEALRVVKALKAGTAKKPILGLLVLSQHIPSDLAQKMREVVHKYREYQQLELFKDPLKVSYLITFLLITLIVIFSAIWGGFHLARGITEPIMALSEGTRAVAEGNLDIHVEREGDDEIAYLVDAFNAMTADLKRGKEHLEQSNAELEARRVYMERVMERIGGGVVSVDRRGRVTTINRSAERMLGVKAKDALESHYRHVFTPALIDPVRQLFRELAKTRVDRLESQRQVTVGGRLLTLLISLSVLTDRDGKELGMVFVFEDLTELLKVQRLAAWREVAQGIAHEIKNPLTPIQLSTQRLKKKYQERSPDFHEILEESTTVIINQVKGLMELVNEFSRFARMPEPRPRTCDLHDLIRETISLYSGHPKAIRFDTNFDPRMGPLNLDEEQMKRVFINLIENAIDAMPDEGGNLSIKTSQDDFRGSVKIEFSDDGPGISDVDRNKLFLPYFTTKRRGTGLGLAIVHRVIAEHNGTIEVRNNLPHGATFEIRLPMNGGATQTRLAV